MKALVTLVAALTFSAGLYAETLYVSDDLRVPLRAKPCSRCSIIHQGIKSGTTLNRVETKDNWSHVTTRSGLDGWMPSQYLLKNQIARIRITKVEQRLQEAQQQNSSLQQQLTEARSAISTMEAQLTEAQSGASSISNELNEIKTISANTISIHQQNQELLERNGLLQNKIDVLTASNERLRNDESQTWFLYGALSVLFGAILAVLLPSLKRRKQFSEWG